MSGCHYYFRNDEIEFYYQKNQCYVSKLQENRTTVIPCSITECQGDGGQNRQLVVCDGKTYALVSFRLVELFPDKLVPIKTLAVANKGINNMKVGLFEKQLIFTDGTYLHYYKNEESFKTSIPALYIYTWCGISYFRNQMNQLLQLTNLCDQFKNVLLYELDSTLDHQCCENGLLVFKSKTSKYLFLIFDLTCSPPRLYKSDQQYELMRKAELTEYGREFPQQYVKNVMGDENYRQFLTRRKTQLTKFNDDNFPISFCNRLQEIQNQYCWIPFDSSENIERNLAFLQFYDDGSYIGFERERFVAVMQGKRLALPANYMRFSPQQFGQCFVSITKNSNRYMVIGPLLYCNDKQVGQIKGVTFENCQFKIALFQNQIVICSNEFLFIFHEDECKLERTTIPATHIYFYVQNAMIWYNGKIKILKSLYEDSLNVIIQDYESTGADVCCEQGLFVSESVDADKLFVIDLTNNYKVYQINKQSDQRLFQGTWFDHFHCLLEFTRYGRQLNENIIKLLLNEDYTDFSQRRDIIIAGRQSIVMSDDLKQQILSKATKVHSKVICQHQIRTTQMDNKSDSSEFIQLNFDLDIGPLPTHTPISMNDRQPLNPLLIALINKAVDFVCEDVRRLKSFNFEVDSDHFVSLFHQHKSLKQEILTIQLEVKQQQLFNIQTACITNKLELVTSQNFKK